MDLFKLDDDHSRRIVAEGLLEISRVIRKGHVDLDHAAISCVMALARINERPVDVSELAKLSGVPRPTVIRKVRAWQEKGMVETHKVKGRTYVMPSRSGATAPNSNWLWASYEKVFRQVAVELSRMDSV